MTTPENADEHEVLAPVPDPTDDLSDVAIFADEDAATDESAPDAAIGAVAGTAYDDETDLALPVHAPDTSAAFTPYAGSVREPDAGAAYDRERDTGL